MCLSLIQKGKTENQNEDVIVEATFENKSRRIPIEEDFISLRRIWTADNKDEYYMNNKILTKNELNNVLESCGLSKSNPYNIIQQGKIQRMTHLSEDEIYNLLQEITGIKQFEEKKRESLKLLAETQVTKKIEELESEKENYADHERKENSAKCLEFLLYQGNVSELQDKLERLGESIRKAAVSYQALRQEEASLAALLESRRGKGEQFQALANTLEEENSKLQEENEGLQVRLRVLQRHEMENEKGGDEPRFEDNSEEIRDLEESVDRQKKNLYELRCRLERLNTFHDKLQLETYTSSNFSSVSERNEFITDQLLALEEDRRVTEGALDANVKQIAEVEKERLAEEANIRACNEKASSLKAKISEANFELLEVKRKRLENSSSLKDLVHSLNDGALSLVDCKKTKSDYRKQLEFAFKDSSFSTARKLVKEASKRGLQGVHGLLLDFLECPSQLNFVLELVAKGKIFALVVEDSEIANSLIEINKEIKGGAVTIYPLTWIKELQLKSRVYPKSQDVYKLVGSIGLSAKGKVFEKEMNKLLENIFGKSILVKTFDMAMKLAKESNFNCVTMEGDIVYAGCYLSRVGLHNFEEDHVKTYNLFSDLSSSISKLKEKIASETKAKESLSDEDVNLCNSIRSISAEIIKLESERAKALASCEESHRRVSDLELATSGLQDLREKLLRDFDSVKKQTEMFSEERSSKSIEKSSNLAAQIESTKGEKEHLQEAVSQAHEELLRTTHSLNKLKMQRGAFFEQQPSTSSTAHLKSECEMLHEQIRRNIEKIKTNQANVSGQKAAMEEGEAESQAAEKRLSEVRISKDELEKKLSESKTQRMQYIDQKNEFISKKGNLELFQAEQLSKYSKLSPKEILNKLKEIRLSEKKKFTAKDRLLFERLETLKEKSTSFGSRLQKISESEAESLALIESLEARAEDTVNNVFNSFKTFFEEYFQSIVSGGSTSMKKIRVPKESNAGKKFFVNGIDLRVQFVFDEAERRDARLQKMEKLSAGQKTVIAIAMIFALQSCDPAPFYIFDEVDAALDPLYRKNVIKMYSFVIQNGEKRR